MSMPVFDSRDPRCKYPYGALPCSTRIFLTLRPPQAEGFASCTLVALAEFASRRWEVPLYPAGEEEDRTLFAGVCDLPEEPDLVWLCFRFTRHSGQVVWLGKNGLCGEGESVCWQQTATTTPSPRRTGSAGA